MTKRPYLTHGIDSLEALFAAHSGEADILDALIAELDFRSDERADDLRRRVLEARGAPAAPLLRLVGPDPDAVLDKDRGDPAPGPESPDRPFDAVRARLLDLSPDNPMLDDRRGADADTHLRLPNGALDEIYRRLTDGSQLDLAPLAEASGLASPPELFASPRGGRSARRLQTPLPAEALAARLDRIAEEAGLCEQETGFCALFLAFGFLEWRSPGTAQTRRLAPLLLLPVQLERRSEHGRTTHMLAATEEAAEINPTLRRLLESEFGCSLPDLPPQGETETPLGAWFDAVDAAVEHNDGWAVRRFLTLGTFAVGRIALHDDLDPRAWSRPAASHPLAGPVLRAMTGPDGNGPPEERPIDEAENEKAAPVLIHDADAAQHAAVADAATGLSLVIQAPPGTGKSHTVANIVADALARGETVLVLAEKQAALEAAKRRLDEAGLGMFCLELHGLKAARRAVWRSLRERMGPQIPRPAPPRPDLAAWDAARKDLAAYAAALHDVQDDGETAFSLIWRSVAGAARHGSAARAFRNVDIPEALLAAPAAAERARREIAVHAEMARLFESAFGPPHQTPWFHLGLDGVPGGAAPDLLDRLEHAHQASLELAGLFHGAEDLGVRTLSDLRQIAAASLPETADLSAVERAAPLDLDRLEEAIALRRAILDCLRDLASAEHLTTLDETLLAQAADVAAAARTCALSELPPAEAYSRAENEMRDAQQLVVAMTGLVGALPILGLDDEIECRLLMPVAAAAAVAPSIPPALRRWLAWRPAGRQEEFERVCGRGKALHDAEAAWRAEAPGYDPADRPHPDDLKDAAAAFRRAGLKRMVSALSGDLGVARDLVRELGLRKPKEGWPEQLERLAAHIEAIEAFEADEEAARIVGPAWAGVETPFALMAGAVRVREAIRDGLKDHFGGADIAERMMLLDERGVTEFGAFAPAALAFRAIPASRALGRESVRTTVRRFEEAIIRLTAFLVRDPDGVFSPIALPIERVAVLSQREIRRRGLVALLSRNPAAAALSDDALDALTDAVAWLRAVRPIALPQPARDALMSGSAEEARRRLRLIAARASGALERLSEAGAALAQDFGLTAIVTDDAEATAQRTAELLRASDAARDFLELQEQRDALERMGLGPFLARAEECHIRPEDVADLFAHLVLRRRIELLRRSRPSLARSGAALEARRRAFADQDRARMERDRAAIRTKLLTAAHGSERVRAGMHLLEKEMRKERGLLDLSRLMREAGAAVQALKPCVMASPLALARHVPAEALAFDLLVIDEASQMRAEDALGGLLRAGRVVAAGDPDELPASDFFARPAASGACREASDAGPVSAFDACAAAFRRVRRLTRHDRSRCESLIAFSNREIYGGRLTTFPAARPGSFAIDLVRLEGRAETGRNPEEAECLAGEAAAFMRRFADCGEENLPTFGIVAVTPEQGRLIGEILRRLEAGDERIARYRERTARRGEPVFVKSLENVQGDRRDHVFASLVYGPADRRFGPFSDRHGARRLNVLATRARGRLGLFVSLGSEDIELDEAASRGEHLLKAYLAYAEGRERALSGAGEPQTLLEAELAARLRARGYEVDFQVGLSQARPVLGVRHPDRPDIRLAGIESDATIHAPGSGIRERDRLRGETMRRLGWEILRIWSTDWFDDPDLQTNRLAIQLEGLRRKEPPAVEDPRIGEVAAIVPIVWPGLSKAAPRKRGDDDAA